AAEPADFATTPSWPSNGLKLISPLVAFSSWQEPCPGRSPPLRVRSSSSVFGLEYSPSPVTWVQTTRSLCAVSSVSFVPWSVTVGAPAPGTHSKAPLPASVAERQAASAYSPWPVALRQRPRSGRL